MKAFKDERGQIITRDELLLEFLHLEAKRETDCKDIIEYINSCTGKNGTLTEYEVPRYGDIVMLNSLAMEDEKLKEWYDGAPVEISLVDLSGWQCWVKGYLYPMSIDYVTILVQNKQRL
jgi:hypothetical protein